MAHCSTIVNTSVKSFFLQKIVNIRSKKGGIERHGVSLNDLPVSSPSAPPREMSVDLISVDDVDLKPAEELRDLVDNLLNNYDHAEGKVEFAKRAVDEAEKKLLEQTEGCQDTVMLLFRTIQQARSEWRLARTDLTNASEEMKEMKRAINIESERLSQRLSVTDE